MPKTTARPAADDRPARKSIELDLKSLDDDGSFVMYAAAFGNVDRGGDVIEPGAFVNLDEFVRDGWIALNHRQNDLAVGYPTAATQDTRGLRVEGKFHTTPEAQALRTVVRERLAAGKGVKSSIGYQTVRSRQAVVDGEPVRRLEQVKIYEASFVNLPMNPEADVVSAKAKSNAASLNRAGEAYARKLIRAGKIADGKWGFDAADAHALLGEDGDDWAAYGQCHLAVDDDVPDDEEGHWKYPFAKRDGDGDGDIRVYADALRAIDSRASQQGKSDISDAARRLLEEVDKQKGKGKSMSVEQKGLLVALKELLGLAGKAAESGKMSKAGMTRLKAFAEEIHEHGERTREHAKEMAEHGKAAQACAKEMKTFIKAYDPDEEPDDEGADDDEEQDEEPKPKKGKKVKDPEDTSDADPPKKEKEKADRHSIAVKLALLRPPPPPRPA